MLPESFNVDYTTTSMPSKTYKIDWENGTIGGFIDGKEAIAQSMELAITTERYIWPIYSWNYGSEIYMLMGQSDAYAMSEMKRMIQDALSQDTRIVATSDFMFEANRGKVKCQFTANTTVGDVNATI